MPASESLKPLLDLRDDAYLLGLRMLRNAADAEDAVQDAYLRVARSNAQLPPEAERRTWFLCIVANAARDLLRSNQRRRTRDTEAAMNATRTGETITSEKRAEIRELREQVVRAVDELEEKFRLPVSLHYEQGLTHAQSAQILQMDHGTVRVYASRGIEMLREQLSRRGITAAPSMLIASLSSEKLAAPPALAQSVETIVSGAKPATGAIVSAKAAGVAAAVLAFAVAFSAMLPHFRPEAPAALIPAVAPQLDEETKGDERTLEANEVSEELAKKLEKRISIRIDDDLRTVLQVLTMKSGVRIVCPLGAEMTPVVCSKENVRVKDVLTSLSRDLEIEIGSDNVAVWKKGDPAEWTRIKKDLESQDWTTRAKACAKLGRWGDRAACKTLLERIYDENYTTRIFALTSLSGFTPVLRHVELPASFEEHLLKQHKEAKDWVTRCSAIKLMGLCSSDESEKVIIEALTADEGMCREAAAQALCMRKSERAKEEVLKLIGHPSWVVRDVVGGALKECPYALAPLLEMAKRARLGVSEFSTLAFLGRESLWPEVSKLIEGGLEPQQENGICLSAYLLQMGDARPRETLATLLKHQDWKIRSAACWALWVSADDGLRDALINTAGADESDDTRSVALLALGRMNDPRATQWLLDQKPSEKDAVSFARALVEARHRQGFERLKTITGAGLERGIYGLTEMRTPEADQLLLDIADGRVPSTGMTRDAAAFCLAMNHHPHGLARLIKLSQDAVAHRGATPMLEQSLGVLLRLAPVIESDFDRDQLGALLNQIKDLRTLQKPAPAGDF